MKILSWLHSVTAASQIRMKDEYNLSARAMWEKKDYVAAVKIGLGCVGAAQAKSERLFAERFLNLAYALYSASELSLFNEFKKIFSSYMEMIALNETVEPPIGYHNHACLMQHNLITSVFNFYESDGEIDDVKEGLRLLVNWSNRVRDKGRLESANLSLIRLATLIGQKKPPFFTVHFKLPFSLALPNGTYELDTTSNPTTISIESFTATDVSSRLKDRHFSQVEIKVKGFTCTNNYWFGPDIESEHQEPRNTRLALKHINQVILNAKLVNESIRSVLATQNDIGTATTTQFNGEGEVFHFSIALGFGGYSLIDALSKQELSEDQVKQFTEKLKNGKLLLHDELFGQALIEADNLNLVAAFYLLNSAAEAMIDYFLLLLAEQNGKLEAYSQFSKGNSYCLQCELFKAAVVSIEPPRAAVPPSPFQKLKFLQEIGVSTTAEVKDSQKILGKIRNDKMRNDLTHGRCNDIRKAAVYDATKGFQDLKRFFSTLCKS